MTDSFADVLWRLFAGERFYHGGQPGLEPGDLILPPAETGITTLGSILAEHDPWLHRSTGRYLDLADRVYLADLGIAVGYACLWTACPWTEHDGAVYAVRPLGELERDPDPDSRARGRCWMASRAEITRVVYPAVARGSSSHGVLFKWGQIGRALADVDRARAEGRCVTEAEHQAWTSSLALWLSR